MKRGGIIARFQHRGKKLFVVTISTMEEKKLGSIGST